MIRPPSELPWGETLTDLLALPLEDRMREYQRRIVAGDISPNDVRGNENMNPSPNEPEAHR